MNDIRLPVVQCLLPNSWEINRINNFQPSQWPILHETRVTRQQGWVQIDFHRGTCMATVIEVALTILCSLPRTPRSSFSPILLQIRGTIKHQLSTAPKSVSSRQWSRLFWCWRRARFGLRHIYDASKGTTDLLWSPKQLMTGKISHVSFLYYLSSNWHIRMLSGSRIETG